MEDVKTICKTLTLHTGSEAEIKQLARIRGLSTEGLLMAQERGLLRFGCHMGYSAWFVLDKTHKAIQARRLDGQHWGGNLKALSVKGSQGNWPIGLYESLDYPNVAIVEGGPDLIAAHHFLWEEKCDGLWGVIAMLGAVLNFPSETIQVLKGKRIKIFYHHDKEKQGAKAAYRWGTTLGLSKDSSHFCCGPVELQRGGYGKDLNDQAHISGNQFEEQRTKNMHLLFT